MSSALVSYRLEIREVALSTKTNSERRRERKFLMVAMHLVIKEAASTLLYSNGTGETTLLDIGEGHCEPSQC